MNMKKLKDKIEYTREFFAEQGKKGGDKSWVKYKTKASRKKRLENAHNARRKKPKLSTEKLGDTN